MACKSYITSNEIAPDVYLASVTSLYAFFYQPSPIYAVTDGWTLYSLRDEFTRMGVGVRSKAWRFTDINKDYSVS